MPQGIIKINICEIGNIKKGGRIKFDAGKWVVDAKYRHFASEKEAAALNLLGFKPKKTGLTSITCRVYKNITINDSNYNDSIYSLYHKLNNDPKKQERIINLFKEAYKLRIEENKKFKFPTEGHINYPENMLNVPYGLNFGLVGSPINRRKTIKKKSNAPRRIISRLSRFDLLSPQGRRDSVRFINYEEELAEVEALSELIEELEIAYTTNYSERGSKKIRKRKRRDTRREKKRERRKKKERK